MELLNKCKVYQEIVKSQLSDKEYDTEIKMAKKYQKDSKISKPANQIDRQMPGKVEYA